MKRIISVLIILLLAANCTPAPAPGTIVADQWPTEEWPTMTPEEQGFSPSLLETMEEKASNYRINNIIIVRNGYKVYHRFVYENFMKGEGSMVPVYSCTKSIISALVGIALNQGYINSIDQRVSEFFPEWEELEPNELRDAITIEHLLNQTSGWDWPEFGAWNYHISYLTESEDWIRCVLKRDMEVGPGTKFNYSTGASHLLSVIVARATGQDTLSFARKYLFDPIGIGPVDWPQDPQGYYTGGHGLWMSAEDLARFGLLYLKKGTWDGSQVVPADWVEASTSRQSEGHFRGGGGEYGYQWWVATLYVNTKPVEVAYALGYAGQYVYVVPEYDMVVVATSQNVEHPNVIRDYLVNYILKPIVK